MEILVVVVIIGILSAVAIPDLRSLLQNHRAATQANEFVTDFNLARSEAISRRSRVTMCKSGDGQSCAPDGQWDQGWIVFEESVTVNGVRDDGEEIIKVREGLGGVSTLKGNSPVNEYISFLPSGFPRKVDGSLQPGTITLECGRRGIDLVINSGGRIRMVKK